MNKLSFATSKYRQIRDLARPYYNDDTWLHVQDVRRRAAKMMRALEHRSLTPAEYAAVLFHDSTKRDLGKHGHGPAGALRARQVLAAALSTKEIAEAAGAIRGHMDNLKKFPSHTAELLASADANPPDIDWFLNKAYCYNRPKLDVEKAMTSVIDNGIAKEVYGAGGRFHYPGIYQDYYGKDKVEDFRRTISDMDREFVKQHLQAYHKKYGIDPDNPIQIHNR